MSITAVYLEIQQSINSGTVFSLPRKKLEQFVSALSRANAFAHFGASEFPGTCETVRMALSMRVSEDANLQAKKESRIALIVSLAALVVGLASAIAEIWPLAFPTSTQAYATLQKPLCAAQDEQIQKPLQEPALHAPPAKPSPFSAKEKQK